MRQEIVEKALEIPDSVYIGKIIHDSRPSNVKQLLISAKYYLGDRSWITAGLGAVKSGHPNQAAAIAVRAGVCVVGRVLLGG